MFKILLGKMVCLNDISNSDITARLCSDLIDHLLLLKTLNIKYR